MRNLLRCLADAPPSKPNSHRIRGYCSSLVAEQVQHLHDSELSPDHVPDLFFASIRRLIAVVELEEGVRMNSVIVDAAPEDLEVGMAIEPVFHKDGDATLLYFRPTE